MNDDIKEALRKEMDWIRPVLKNMEKNLYQLEKEAAVKAEREAICRWLRIVANTAMPSTAWDARNFADRITTGEHHKTIGPKTG